MFQTKFKKKVCNLCRITSREVFTFPKIVDVTALEDDVYMAANCTAGLQLSVNIYIRGDTSLFICSLYTDPHISPRHGDRQIFMKHLGAVITQTREKKY